MPIALRIISCRRIGHDFDTLDLVRRDLVEGELSLFAVQQDDRRSIAQRDIARCINLQRRYLPQSVLRGASLTGQAIGLH